MILKDSTSNIDLSKIDSTLKESLILLVSKSLGHNRTDIVKSHYINIVKDKKD